MTMRIDLVELLYLQANATIETLHELRVSAKKTDRPAIDACLASVRTARDTIANIVRMRLDPSYE